MILFGLIAVAEAVAVRPERVLFLLAVAAIGAALPLSSAIRELRHPRDASPLDIDSNYRQEDRFFATSFESRVSTAVGPSPREPGPYAVVFRDAEVIDTVAGSLTIEKGYEPESIVDVHEDLTVGSGVRLAKEAIVGRNAVLESGSSVRALKSEGDIDVRSAARVERWIDAAGTIRAAPLSDLGIRATSLTAIILDDDVTFRFLAAPVISVGDGHDGSLHALPEMEPTAKHAGNYQHRIRADGAVIVEQAFTLAAGTACRGDLVVRGDVTIGDRVVFAGSIHSDRDVIIGANARVTGSIVAERNAIIHPHAVVEEHLVAHGRATLGAGACIGTSGRTMTLLADGGVELGSGATVFGRIVTYGVGRSVSPRDTAQRA